MKWETYANPVITQEFQATLTDRRKRMSISGSRIYRKAGSLM